MKHNSKRISLSEEAYDRLEIPKNPDKDEPIDCLCIWFLVSLLVASCVLGYIVFEMLAQFASG